LAVLIYTEFEISDIKAPEVCADTTFYITALAVTPENPIGTFIAILCARLGIVFVRKHRKAAS
jgi:hypothetical protein